MSGQSAHREQPMEAPEQGGMPLYGWRFQRPSGGIKWLSIVATLVMLASLLFCLTTMTRVDPSEGEAEAILEANIDPTAALAIPQGWRPSVQRLKSLKTTKIISQALRFIRRRYVEPRRINPGRMFHAAVKSMAAELDALLVTPKPNQTIVLRVGERSLSFESDTISDLGRLDRALNRAVNFVARQLPGESLRAHVEYAAINGLLDTLDPYSAMLDPEAWHEMKTHTGGQFGGLGIRILLRAGVLTVESVIDGSPASRAGLKAADTILQINGEDALNISVDDAVDRLRGKVGTSVRLLIGRSSWKTPRQVRLTRAIIRLQSVEGRLLQGDVGYVRIKNFQRGTSAELERRLLGIKPPGGFRGIVLDLRGNPGGLLDEAVKVCDLWLEGGPVVITVAGGQDDREVRSAHTSTSWSTIPVVVLISQRSASASEIVAGALRQSNRALLMGERSWGKGTVQVPFEIGEGALKLTVAKYLLPGDINIQDVGVNPDIAIDFVDVGAKRTRLFSPSKNRNRRTPWATSQTQTPQQRKSIHHLRIALPKGQAASTFRELTPIDRAAQLLTVAGETQASRFLSRSRDWLQRVTDEDEQELIDQLKRKEIVWRRGQSAQNPHVTITMERPGVTQNVQAGQRFTVQLRVRNAGKRPVYRVHLFSQSQSPALDGVESLVGFLKPGQSKIVKMTLRPSRRHLDVTLPVRFVVSIDGKRTHSQTEQMVKIVSLPKPSFSWRLRWRSKSHAPGALRVNERAELEVEIRNDGDSPSQRTKATLRSLAGRIIHVEHGRVEVGMIPPKESRTVVFTVKVQDDISLPSPGLLTMRLDVWDAHMAVRRKERIYLPWHGDKDGSEAVRARALQASRFDQWQEPPHIDAKAHLSDPKTCVADLTGQVRFAASATGMRTITITAEGIKRAYIDATGKTSVLLKRSLRLDKRLNRITIRARIGRRQMRRLDLLVYCSNLPSSKGDSP